MKKAAGLIMVAMIASGCSFVPDYVRPKMRFGNAWGNSAAMPAGVSSSEVLVAKDWWRLFGSDELNGLVTQALNQNNDLVAAAERIKQARGSLKIATASLLPSVNAGVNANSNRVDINNASKDSVGASANASYELDLFGANRASRKAAKAALAAAGYDRDALALTTASDVAQNYFSLLALRERIGFATDSLKASEQVLTLLETRLRVGTVGLLEVSQQRSAVAQAQANVASLNEQAATFKNALAILAGTAPQDFTVSGTSVDSVAMPEVPLNPPATLLERRPDLRVAEENLIAANADIGAARAAFFPATSLSAGLVQSFNPALTGLNLGAAALAPIFSGGANAGALQTANARQRELAANYRQAVLISFQDASNALATLESANIRHSSQTTAAESADTALRLAQAQLQAGTIDLPTLLNTQTTQLSARDAATQAVADALNARVELIRAMGGGWVGPIKD